MRTYLYKRDRDGKLFMIWYDRSCRSWYGNECREIIDFSMCVDPRRNFSTPRTTMIKSGTSALLRRWVRIGWLKLLDENFELEVDKPAEFMYRREELEELFGLKRLECLGVLSREEVVR